MHIRPTLRFAVATLAFGFLVMLAVPAPALAETRQPLDCRLVTPEKAATCCPLIVDILPANRMPRICTKVLADMSQRGADGSSGTGGSDAAGAASGSKTVAKSFAATSGTAPVNDKSGAISSITMGGGAPGIFKDEPAASGKPAASTGGGKDSKGVRLGGGSPGI